MDVLGWAGLVGTVAIVPAVGFWLGGGRAVRSCCAWTKLADRSSLTRRVSQLRRGTLEAVEAAARQRRLDGAVDQLPRDQAAQQLDGRGAAEGGPDGGESPFGRVCSGN